LRLVADVEVSPESCTVICISVKAVEELTVAELFVIVNVVLNVVDRFSSTEIKVPKAGLNWGNFSELFQSVGVVSGIGVLVVMGPRDWFEPWFCSRRPEQMPPR